MLMVASVVNLFGEAGTGDGKVCLYKKLRLQGLIARQETDHL